MKNKEQIYFIAGCPRSGTSLIAGLLAKHGVWVGNTTPGDKHNEKGYFENKEIGRIIKEIMRQNEMKKRSDIKNIPKKLKIDFNLREAFLKIVKDNKVWLFKDSKILFLFPLFKKAFPEAIWILPYRDINKIIRSLQNHTTWQKRLSRVKRPKKYCQEMVLKLVALQDRIRSNTVNYIDINSHTIVQDTNKAKKFIENCGLEFSEEIYNEFVSPELWHV